MRFGRVNAARYPAPGWYPDPTRRHEYRWWANKWTDHVGDGGRADRDPLGRPVTVPLALFLPDSSHCCRLSGSCSSVVTLIRSRVLA